RAVEAAGDVNTLLLDKTGTITHGNRLASAFHPVPGVTAKQLAEASLLASLADETPEGRSIAALAKGSHGIAEPAKSPGAQVIPFSATTRISGIDLDGKTLRKGAIDAIVKEAGLQVSETPAAFRDAVERISRTGGTPLGVIENGRLFGVI